MQTQLTQLNKEPLPLYSKPFSFKIIRLQLEQLRRIHR